MADAHNGPRWLDEGYAVGFLGESGTWVTVLGSFYYPHMCVYASRADAQAWLDARGKGAHEGDVAVYRVRRVSHPGVSGGWAFERVLCGCFPCDWARMASGRDGVEYQVQCADEAV